MVISTNYYSELKLVLLVDSLASFVYFCGKIKQLVDTVFGFKGFYMTAKGSKNLRGSEIVTVGDTKL